MVFKSCPGNLSGGCASALWPMRTRFTWSEPMLMGVLFFCMWLAMPLGCILVMAFLIFRSWARKVGYEISMSKLRKALRVVAIAVGTAVTFVVVAILGIILYVGIQLHFDPNRPKGFSQTGMPQNLKVYVSGNRSGMELYDKENATGTQICEAKPINKMTDTLLAFGAVAVMPDGKELLVSRYSIDGWSTHSVSRVERRNAAGQVKWAAEMGQDKVEHLAISPDAKSFLCIVSWQERLKQLKWMSFEDKTTTLLLTGYFCQVEWSNDPNHVWLIEEEGSPHDLDDSHDFDDPYSQKALYFDLKTRQAEATFDDVQSACAVKDGYVLLYSNCNVILCRNRSHEKVEVPFSPREMKSLPDGTGVVFYGGYPSGFGPSFTFGYLDCEKKTAFSVMESYYSDDYAASTN